MFEVRVYVPAPKRAPQEEMFPGNIGNPPPEYAPMLTPLTIKSERALKVRFEGVEVPLKEKDPFDPFEA